MTRYAYNGKCGDRYWKLCVWYDLNKHGWGVPDEEVWAAIGPPDGAGTGFNQRDMDWAFADALSAQKAFSHIKQIIGNRDGFHVDLAVIELAQDEDDEDDEDVEVAT